ncbi:hypothetical protein LZG04_27640 [Saccharothrix sp. S26]|uniref:hypothetical protein n=1 Tax=Saccharothrix sp. S26 TaxID=2907215 RepID=UPI001F3CCBD6|nr:hypothetical protein [Saccharothrix sp. S26]MCE6998543.1 hypothetical protein [Saccharothrix sp. S26]
MPAGNRHPASPLRFPRRGRVGGRRCSTDPPLRGHGRYFIDVGTFAEDEARA